MTDTQWTPPSFEDKVQWVIDAALNEGAAETARRVDLLSADEVRVLSLTCQQVYRISRDAWLNSVTQPKEQDNATQ